jgi:hypothetical protein
MNSEPASSPPPLLVVWPGLHTCCPAGKQQKPEEAWPVAFPRLAGLSPTFQLSDLPCEPLFQEGLCLLKLLHRTGRSYLWM